MSESFFLSLTHADVSSGVGVSADLVRAVIVMRAAVYMSGGDIQGNSKVLVSHHSQKLFNQTQQMGKQYSSQQAKTQQSFNVNVSTTHAQKRSESDHLLLRNPWPFWLQY